MKTIKIITLVVISVIATSCGSYYRTITKLSRNGNAQREIYAKADSTFMSGNIANNPYLFDINSGWAIKRFKTPYKYNFFGEDVELNVMISQKATSVSDFSEKTICSEIKRPLAAPKESLTKKFRWFYTTYTYTCIYPKINYDVPVSINKYLTPKEQRLWSQGDFDKYKALNGAEMSNMLNDIEKKFINWYYRNLFEISIDIIEEKYNGNISHDVKEDVYRQLYNGTSDSDITPYKVCKQLDISLKGNSFEKLYNHNEKIISKEFDSKTSVIYIINNIISYELIVPGEIISTNSPIIKSDTLIWKVDGTRNLFNNYTLSVEYRIINTWAFIISILVVLIAIISIVIIKKRNISKHRI